MVCLALEFLELGDGVFSFWNFGMFWNFWNWEMVCLVFGFFQFLEELEDGVLSFDFLDFLEELEDGVFSFGFFRNFWRNWKMVCLLSVGIFGIVKYCCVLLNLYCLKRT